MNAHARFATGWRGARLIAVPALTVAWFLGFLLGARNDLLVWLYYIPAPVTALLGAAWCLACARRVRRLLYIGTLLLTLLATAKVLVGDMRWHATRPTPPGALRVVHWNVAYARFGREPVLKRIDRHQPDLVFLSECRYTDKLSNEVRNVLGFAHTFQDQGMAIACRYPFAPQGTIPLTSARAWWARISMTTGPLDVVIVDLVSHPYLNREEPLNGLAAWIAQHDSAIPLLIAGDFNTPRDARAFRPLRAQLQHAYETAGHGWPYSWPLPVPVYSLDHVWFSDRLRVTNYRLHASRLSDHLRQVMDVEILPLPH